MPSEAVVRGHKSGLFSAADYNNLCQCESLEDIKLHLVSGPPPSALHLQDLASQSAAGCVSPSCRVDRIMGRI